ncbi:hypothetical protein H4R19_000590 [Coemansia spiralis]|nr:hypothetical protein H4R19_000590 [Coemansia spiralis]
MDTRERSIQVAAVLAAELENTRPDARAFRRLGRGTVFVRVSKAVALEDARKQAQASASKRDQAVDRP